MSRRYTTTVVHETHSEDEQIGEFTLKVTFDVIVAEPEIGITQPSLELVDVQVVEHPGMYVLTAASLRDTLMNDEAWFAGLYDELIEDAGAQYEAAAEHRAEMRREPV